MKRRSDEEISAPLYEYDAAIRAQYGFFAGVDEAGRTTGRSLWRPVSLTRRSRCTASTTPRS